LTFSIKNDSVWR